MFNPKYKLVMYEDPIRNTTAEVDVTDMPPKIMLCLNALSVYGGSSASGNGLSRVWEFSPEISWSLLRTVFKRIGLEKGAETYDSA
jgi:hypothetical protein